MKVHFIGIGGIGISAIACIYKQKNWIVSGSDEEQSEITDGLKQMGMDVFIGHKKENLWCQTCVRHVSDTKPNLVVYSEAVPKENIELKEAKKLKIKCLSGAQALADLAKDYFLIAVSGMHGKSTTASMVAQILIKAKLDPSFIIGTKPGWRLGKSKYLIIEADDYKAKLLNYNPDILVLTNIEEEHMDYFENLNHILKVFLQYAKQVNGFIVGNRDNKNVVKIFEKLKTKPARNAFSIADAGGNEKVKIKKYSLDDKEAKVLEKILKIPGEHNVSNALAALNVARILDIKDEVSFKALSEFKGIWRRFQETELRIRNHELRIVADYAHHPTEILATFQALHEKYSNKKILVIFQPHQYQRTFYLFNDFVKTFQQAKNFGIEKVIITDIYSVKGRESQEIKSKTNSQKLVKAINCKEVEYIKQEKLENYIKDNLKDIDVLTIMGAGDIYKLAQKLK